MNWIAMADATYSRRERPDGGVQENWHYFAGSQRDARAEGRGGVIVDAPHGFLTRRPPGEYIAPHFHDVPQYQIVVGGGGRIGKHPLAPITVHYVDSYTPYGPIVGADQGIAFFTLRAQITACDAQYMPECRPNLLKKAGRAFTANVRPVEGSRDLLPPTEDGVAARALSLAAGEAASLAPAPGGGRFVLVLDGSLADGAEKFACAFQPAGEPAIELRAGPDGARLLALDFGPPSADARPLRRPAAA